VLNDPSSYGGPVGWGTLNNDLSHPNISNSFLHSRPSDITTVGQKSIHKVVAPAQITQAALGLLDSAGDCIPDILRQIIRTH